MRVPPFLLLTIPRFLLKSTSREGGLTVGFSLVSVSCDATADVSPPHPGAPQATTRPPCMISPHVVFSHGTAKLRCSALSNRRECSDVAVQGLDIASLLLRKLFACVLWVRQPNRDFAAMPCMSQAVLVERAHVSSSAWVAPDNQGPVRLCRHKRASIRPNVDNAGLQLVCNSAGIAAHAWIAPGDDLPAFSQCSEGELSAAFAMAEESKRR